MKILLTGANGFLGYYLSRHLLDHHHTVIATGRGECRLPFTGEENFIYASMDFTDPFAVHDIFNQYKPEAVVHAGAMSKPDECEQQQWQAYLVNVEGTITMVLNAEEQKSFFIFLSTDFIFDGKRGMYREDDEPGPLNFYGRTKLEAEDAVKEFEGNWAIVRTVSVYGKSYSGRGNLLSIVKDKLEKGEEYAVFDDQVRTPTYVGDLAAGIAAIIEKKATGIFHISGDEVLTPYQVACRAAAWLGLKTSLIRKITEGELASPAKRPLNTGFIIEKAKRELGFIPVSFDQGLRKTFGSSVHH